MFGEFEKMAARMVAEEGANRIMAGLRDILSEDLAAQKAGQERLASGANFEEAMRHAALMLQIAGKIEAAAPILAKQGENVSAMCAKAVADGCERARKAFGESACEVAEAIFADMESKMDNKENAAGAKSKVAEALGSLSQAAPQTCKEVLCRLEAEILAAMPGALQAAAASKAPKL